ncbi:type III-B CRISPR-associated protein Cas10/Cmr2 [Paenibacillus amylolyticus]|uniref:Type III-B CRISPR-associated protein Cas10/Cmr2 n=1 Tax=Paenibacillus amylolyticus TaxID=1451 RepID=A0ABD8B2Q1_PAEAM
MENNQLHKTLILISIGPVQEFIAQARRTRDLWFGSFLLSELSKAGGEKFIELGGTLVYPVLNVQDSASFSYASAPNKILGEITTDNPKEVAQKVRSAIIMKWKEYTKRAQKIVDFSINIGTWKRQVNDVVEFYASWISLDRVKEADAYRSSGKSVYNYALEQAESLLAARKQLRDFKPNEPGVMYGEKKSTLDGGRESVWREHEQYKSRLTRYGIKEHETLDAISVVKRLSLKLIPEQQQFPSVCEVAYLPYRDLIRQDAVLGKAVMKYLEDVDQLVNRNKRSHLAAEQIQESACITYDEARLFYDRRIEDYLEEVIQLEASQREPLLKQIMGLLERLYQGDYGDGGSLKRPSPYYAFLIADGDHMGKQLRSITDIHSHIRFSEALSDFSSKAATLMKKHQGQLVYGGGDDVMAYLPVHQCLDAAQELRDCFIETMKSVISPDSEIPPTLSIGIVIAHMLEPLEEVRLMAHQAEKLAKETRDAFAIHFHKRGGGDVMKVSFPFKEEPILKMRSIREWRAQSYFSVKFAYELREIYTTYMKMSRESSWVKDNENFGQLIQMEIERLALKKKPEGISHEKLHKWIEEELKPIYQPGNRPLEQLRRMAEQFIVAIQLEEVGQRHE